MSDRELTDVSSVRGGEGEPLLRTSTQSVGEFRRTGSRDVSDEERRQFNSYHGTEQRRGSSFVGDPETESEYYRMRTSSNTISAPPRTLEEKHQQMNTLFGIRPNQTSVYARPLEKHSAAVQSLYIEPNQIKPPVVVSDKWYSKIDCYIWVILCGWWVCLLYGLVGGILSITIVGRPHGRLCLMLARYYLWPFGKVVSSLIPDEETTFTTRSSGKSYRKERGTQRVQCGISCSLWCIFAWTILLAAHLISFIICWFLVIFIPMAKAMRVGIVSILFSPSPLDITVTEGYPSTQADVLLCTFSAVNKYYYKYSVFGVNVVLLNLLPVVVAALFFAYIPLLFPWMKLPDEFMFVVCLCSAVPLAYYIGLALSSLSAQTSFSVGAVLNATFGSIIELILYFSALFGGLSDVVQASVTGSLLALMLLLPGLAMLFGGMKCKEMKFNPASAGVSGVLLLLSVVGTFIPTIYYLLFGHYVLDCTECEFTNSTQVCRQCTWEEGYLEQDPVYEDSTKYLMWVCAGILPLSYIVGLIFTLKTHAHIVDDPAYIDQKAALEHVPDNIGPKWSKFKCILILSICTIMFGLLAEEIVKTLEPSLEGIGITNTFAGITIIAVVSYTAEFVNAILFAVHNNFSMSLEIANSAAVQVALIQIPCLILFSAILDKGEAYSFTLVFPTLDVFTVLLAVIIMNYISIDGKANYFLGFTLLIIYVLMISVYYYVPAPEEGGEGEGYYHTPE